MKTKTAKCTKSNEDLYFDMWYGDIKESADKIDVCFYPNDCCYRGNIYKDGKMIGDYECSDSLLLETLFPQLTFHW